ncbi:MAG TPA: sensor histidine kinase [Solirubrobacteraceae bacterium]|nr:sensor histidine kinase [Solirubrobacteraceae bacterium]
MAEPERDQFRIDPLVVFKLGEELVSDETQALLELIKNAYDADASFVRVAIHTSGAPEKPLLKPDKQSPGWIEIADDGVGMDEATIGSGWLLIARSGKRDFKQSGKTTAKKRTPLGDKGLGRLGAQRLGWGLQIVTKTAEAKRARALAFSWKDFLAAETLDQVRVKSGFREPTRKHGTVLTISELQNPDQWAGDGIVKLQRELSEVISPYEGVVGFTVAVSIDGTQVDLQKLRQDVRDTALLHYDIKFEKQKLTIAGHATLGLFRPSGRKAVEQYAQLVEHDRGAAFYKHLVDAGAAKAVGLKKGRGRWFVDFKRERKLSDLPQARRDEEKAPIDPGPFKAEVDSFSLALGDNATVAVFGNLADYRKFIKDLAGIRVYRDGFAVRTDRDWLGLGSQWTSARSYYGLKPDTTLGYVAIGSRENAQLIEKTDREGFINTAAYQNFLELMKDFLSFTEEVQELLRREYLEFAKINAEESADVGEEDTPESVSESIDDLLDEGNELQRSVASAQAIASKAQQTASSTLDSATDDDEEGLIARREQATEQLQTAMSSVQGTLAQLNEFLPKVELAQNRNRVLREEILQMRAQIEDGIETMGLGLTAEALSHEMFNIANSLATRTQEFARRFTDGTIDDSQTRIYLEYIRGSIGALRKELAHFSPSLQYVRERRESIDMRSFSEEIAQYYSEHWQDRNISTIVRGDSTGRFVIRGSRGRLTQVFDNLLLNSGYWIGAAQDRGEIEQGQITIRLRSPIVTISDNGLGVEPSVENSLFDAFVTRKPRGSGRGLGLFIVRQLLDSEGCSITLGSPREPDGRPRDFIVNLGGMLDEG